MLPLKSGLVAIEECPQVIVTMHHNPADIVTCQGTWEDSQTRPLNQEASGTNSSDLGAMLALNQGASKISEATTTKGMIEVVI